MKKTYKLFIWSFFNLSFITLIQAQNTFSKVISHVSNYAYGFSASSVVQTLDNGYIVVGQSDTLGLIMKLDSSGKPLWNKSIGTNKLAYNSGVSFNSIAVTRDSCFVIVGKIPKRLDSLYSDVFCIKINSKGDTLWTQSVDIGYDGTAYSIQQTYDNGYVISAQVVNKNSAIIKLNSAGNLQWTEIFDSSANECYSVKQTPDSGYVLIGDYNSLNYPTGYLLKLTSKGVISWCKTFNVSNSNYSEFWGQGVQLANDGIVSLYQGANAFPTTTGNTYLIKTDFAGNIIWTRRFPVNSAFGHINLKRALDSTYVFVTASNDSYFSNSLLKVGSNGELLWIRNMQLNGVDVVESKDKGYLIVGDGPVGNIGVRLSNNSIVPGSQIGIIKTDSMGENISSCLFKTDTTTSTYNLFTGTASFGASMLLTGSYNSKTAIVSIALISDTGCVSVNPAGSIDENKHTVVFAVYPNPSNGLFTLKLTNASGPSYLHIYNLAGQETFASLLTVDVSSINLDGYAKGLYMYRLINQDGEPLSVGKMIVE